MLNRLPPELIILIIELSLPPDYAYSRYKERQDTLSKYCLVCKELREIAQPILWRVFESNEIVSEVFGQQKDMVKLVRSFRVDGSVTPARPLGGALGKLSQSLVDLRLEGNSKMEIFLHCITSTCSSCATLTPFFSFTKLTSLTLFEMKIPSSPSPFTRSTLPSLRALCLRQSILQNKHSQAPLIDLPSLRPQLDALQVHFSDLFRTLTPSLFGPLSTISPSLFEGPPAVLLTFSLAHADTFLKLLRNGQFPVEPVKHLQLDAFPSSDLKHLAKVEKLIEHLPSIVSLSLPFQLHPSQLNTFQLNCLLYTCGSRKIDLTFRRDSLKPGDDQSLNHDFWRYARELKRGKTEEVEAEATKEKGGVADELARRLGGLSI